MNEIDVDNEVYRRLGEIALPFQETTPNMVIRRLLELPEVQSPTNVVPVNVCQFKKEKLVSSLPEPQSHSLQSSSIENYMKT